MTHPKLLTCKTSGEPGNSTASQLAGVAFTMKPYWFRNSVHTNQSSQRSSQRRKQDGAGGQRTKSAQCLLRICISKTNPRWEGKRVPCPSPFTWVLPTEYWDRKELGVTALTEHWPESGPKLRRCCLTAAGCVCVCVYLQSPSKASWLRIFSWRSYS